MFRASLLSSLQSSKKILKNEYFHFHGEINTSSLFYRQPHFNPRFFLPSRGIFHFNQPKRKRRFSWELPDSKPPPPPREGHYRYSLSELDKISPPEVSKPDPKYVYRWEEETPAPKGLLGAINMYPLLFCFKKNGSILRYDLEFKTWRRVLGWNRGIWKRTKWAQIEKLDDTHFAIIGQRQSLFKPWQWFKLPEPHFYVADTSLGGFDEMRQPPHGLTAFQMLIVKRNVFLFSETPTYPGPAPNVPAILFYSWSDKQWKYLKVNGELPKHGIPKSVAACTNESESKIYIAWGYPPPINTLLYELDTQTWELVYMETEPRPLAFNGASLSHTGTRLLKVGGTWLPPSKGAKILGQDWFRVIDVFDFLTGKWVRASLAKDSITFGMAYHRILQFEDVLLTLGGETLDGEISKITRIIRSDEYYPPGIKIQTNLLHPSKKEISAMIKENIRQTVEKSQELLNDKDSKPPPSTSTSPPQQ